jgi:Protein of unknown function (DUF3237)
MQPFDLEFVLELRVTIGPAIEIGPSAAGLRRVVPITGGTFCGPQLSGIVLPGGADWQCTEESGLTIVDARYVIETADRVRIQIHNQGIRHAAPEVAERLAAGKPVDPGEYYFRTTPRFMPTQSRYEWLRQAVFLGVAERYPDLVVVKVFKVP